MRRRSLLLFVLIICLSLPLSAQSTSSTSGLQPEPYDLTKIPPGVLDLRRFEIIMFGAMPVVYLFAEIITSTALYAKYQTSEYIPLVGSGELSNNEKMYTVGVTFSLAFLVATIDMILYNKKRNDAENTQERRLRVRRAEELFGGIDENFTPQKSPSLSSSESSSYTDGASDSGGPEKPADEPEML